MIRISKALLVSLTLIGCSQGQLSGGNNLSGSKPSSEDSEDDTDPNAPAEKTDTEEGTDAPVWVNASYLTCASELAKSTKDNVAILCQLNDADKQPIVPDDTKVEWVALDAQGEPVEAQSEAASTDRIDHRFYFPGNVVAARGIGVKFNGHDLAQGKKVALKDAIKGLEDGGEIKACLEAAQADMRACLKNSSGEADNIYSSDPLTQARIFVLSTLNSGNLGGVGGADVKCQAGADAASLGGSFRALISSSTQNARDIVPLGIPIVDVANSKVSNSAGELFDNVMLTPLIKSENGGVVSDSGVWTGTNTSGVKSSYHCNNWTSTNSQDRGNAGRVGQTSSAWIYADEFYSGSAPCLGVGHLYCIEMQPK